jgi:hypothetical protein
MTEADTPPVIRLFARPSQDQDEKRSLHSQFWYRFMIRIRLAALEREPFGALA